MSTYTPSLGLERIAPGDQAGLWGNTTNNNMTLIDQSISGVTTINFAGLTGQTEILTSFNGTPDQARSAVLNLVGVAAGPNTVIVPNKQKTYLVRNNTTQTVTFQTASPNDSYPVPGGNSILIFCDGNNNVYTGILSPTLGPTTVAGGGTGNPGPYTAGFVKTPGGTGAFTSVAAVDLNSSDTTNVLPVNKGGTGLSTIPAGSILRGAGTAAPAAVTGTAGVPGQVLTWNGSQWEPAAPASAGVSSITGGTGISVSSPTGAVSITNTGVTSLTAGSGITISGGSTGALSISATGTSGVSSVSVTSPITNTGSSTAPNIGISTSPTFSGTVTANELTSTRLTVNVSSTPGDLRLQVVGTGLGVTSGMSPGGVQIGASSWGILYNSGVPRIETIGGGNVFHFSQSGQNYQGNNSPNWSTLSDENIKTNVRPINNALAKLSALKPSHFEYKNQLGETRSGFIAQEFATVFPGHTMDIVADEEYRAFLPEGQTTVKTVDLNMVPYLVKAIQELKAELDEAKAEIAALKAQ